MSEWSLNDHLPHDLLVRKADWKGFHTIEELWSDLSAAFRSTPRDLGQEKKGSEKKEAGAKEKEGTHKMSKRTHKTSNRTHKTSKRPHNFDMPESTVGLRTQLQEGFHSMPPPKGRKKPVSASSSGSGSDSGSGQLSLAAGSSGSGSASGSGSPSGSTASGGDMEEKLRKAMNKNKTEHVTGEVDEKGNADHDDMLKSMALGGKKGKGASSRRGSGSGSHSGSGSGSRSHSGSGSASATASATASGSESLTDVETRTMRDLKRAGKPLDQDGLWWYEDHDGQTQGPYKTPQMMQWCADGHLEGDLKVRRESWHHSYTISSLWPEMRVAFCVEPRNLSKIHKDEEKKGVRERGSSSGKALHEYKGDWYYEGEDGHEEGPFRNRQMCEWNLHGHLPLHIKVL